VKHSKHIFKYFFIVLLSISSCLASTCSVFSMQETSKTTSSNSHHSSQDSSKKTSTADPIQLDPKTSVNNSKKHTRDKTNDKTNDEENKQKDGRQPPRKKRKITASDDIVSGDKENAKKTETTTRKKRKRQPDLDDNHTTTTSTTTPLPKRQKKSLPKKEYIITVSIDDKPPQTINLASVDISTPLGEKKIAQCLYWSVSKKNINNVQTILDFLQKKLVLNKLNKNTFNEIINDYFIQEKEFIDQEGLIMNALSRACFGGYVDIVRLLITNGASANFANKFGLTPLYFAAAKGHIKVVQWLIEKGKTTVDIKAINDFTPLLIASFRGHVEIIQYLVNKGNASVSITDEHGMTPLHRAAENGQVKAVQWLVQEGKAPVDAVDVDGDAPVHVAALNCYARNASIIIQCLVASGANVYAKNNEKKTAYQIALEKFGQHHEITRLLARAQELVRTMTAHSIEEAFIRRLVLPKMYPDEKWLEQEEAQPAKQNALNLLCKSIQDKSIENNPARRKEKEGHLLDCMYDPNLVGLVYEFLYHKPAQANQKSNCKKI